MKKIKILLFLSVIFLSLSISKSNAQVILEAENAFYSSGIVDTKHLGFTGTGFVDTENAIGEYIEWFINTTDSSTNSLDFKYALGKDENRTMQIFVNEELIGTIDFDSTFLFTNYKYKSLIASLDSGLNRVKAVSVTEQGAPNMDHLRIFVDTTALPYFSVTASTDGNGEVTLTPMADSFIFGSRVTATAVPNPGFSFGQWSGNLSGESNPLIFLVDKEINIGAGFINSLPAFPGAEGFGQNVTGGRGGVVYEVTNLNDNGSGSLRYAIQQPGKRTIVFRVSGTIHLESTLKISSGDLTIAGQTAPGDGITLANHTLTLEANNIIIRYIRCRLGDIAMVENDAMNGRNLQNIILDHCTMSWSVDEAASFYDNSNFTMQYCLISESMYHSVHDKGDHGYGGIWGGKGASFHHNLLAHHTSRNPRFCGSRYSNQADQELVDFRNNVIFNWGNNSGYAGEGGRYNMVNNYYKYGPATSSSIRDRIFSPNADDGTNAQAPGIWGNFYVNGNYVHKYPSVTQNNWIGMDPNPSSKPVSEIKSDIEFDVADVTTESAEIAFEMVMAQVGAVLPKRDSIDNRIIREVISGVPTYGASWGAGTGIIDTQDDVGGWPILNSTPAPADTDHDGMSNVWETARGLNISDPADRNGDDNIDGYTNLEEYLNGIVAENTFIIRPFSLDAQIVSDKTIHLSWVDMVDNESGFLIERSNGSVFEQIATVNANLTSYEETVPEYTRYTYRMRSFNANDTSFFTDTAVVILVPVSPNGINEPNLLEKNLSVNPNPFSDELNIHLNLSSNEEVYIALYTASGKKVDIVLNENIPAGLSSYQLNKKNLAQGVYYLSVQTNKELITRKLVKL